MPVARVVITKQIQWKGQPERWSNGYRFNLPEITTPVIRDLAAALIGMERNLHANFVQFVYANGGRDAKGAEAVYAEDFATPLAGSLAGSDVHPEVCFVVERKLKPRVYARKWFHSCHYKGAPATGEVFDPGDRTTVNSRLVALTNGSLPGGAVYCWPNGEPLDGPMVADPWLRTRQFPRRSPRKKPDPQPAPSPTP